MIDNPDLVAHEARITAQIEYTRIAYAHLNRDNDVDKVSNDDILTMLRFLADAGYRLEPDPDGIMAAARDHMEADKADFMTDLIDHLPPGVKDVIEAAKKAGIPMTLIPIVADECGNPDCPVHGGE